MEKRIETLEMAVANIIEVLKKIEPLSVAQVQIEAAPAKFIYMGLGCLFLWGMSRIADRLMGVDFKEVGKTIATDSLSAAIYFGLRAVAIAIVIYAFVG